MTKIILGLAGEMASGKGTVAQYIVQKYQGNTYRFSTVLRSVAQRMYIEENRENLQKISTIFRQNFFDDILSSVIAQDIENDDGEIIAVDGVRRMADIKYLKKFPNFKLVYIDTEIEKRYQRIIKRGENADDNKKTLDQFKKDHTREAEVQIKNLRKSADFVVDNNGDFTKLYQQVDEIINSFKNKF